MNRSCNSILCRFGIHTADPYVHIQVKCRNGSHRWQSNYEVCKRCGKRLRKIRIVPFDFEKTLVHELLHLKFSFWCQNEDDVGDRVMHQMIDDLARALTEGDSDDEA